MDEHFSRAVPFYDLWHDDGHLPAVREHLPGLLSGVRRSVLEIGAGTGRVTEIIATATPAEIFAVEPALAMRGVLLSRLTDRPELLDRVTVLPCGGLDVELDEPVEAVVLIAVLAAFSPQERERLWPVLARQLEPGGLLVLNHRERPLPESGEEELLAGYRVGRHVYEIRSRVLAAEPGRVTSRFRYLIRQRGVVIDETVVVSDAYRPTRADLEAELARAGFVPAPAPEPLLAWTLG
ncbi:class I SAM-dependent methyltransferase [Nonomuraea sp. NPDC050310]|uniref:class I SAM-dependent methyltransferase n=1 Tax=Nonomuraea sp. NPDC050310 TaxID=3154935 RepID=UPI0033D99817